MEKKQVMEIVEEYLQGINDFEYSLYFEEIYNDDKLFIVLDCDVTSEYEIRRHSTYETPEEGYCNYNADCTAKVYAAGTDTLLDTYEFHLNWIKE